MRQPAWYNVGYASSPVSACSATGLPNAKSAAHASSSCSLRANDAARELHAAKSTLHATSSREVSWVWLRSIEKNELEVCSWDVSVDATEMLDERVRDGPGVAMTAGRRRERSRWR